MDFLDDPARDVLILQILRAKTLPEVHAAQAALRQWRQHYPNDWGILDGGEELSLMEDALMEDDSPPGQLPSWTEWQKLEYLVIGARTVPEISAARCALRDWLKAPSEEIESGYVDTLFLLLEVVEEQVANAHPVEMRPRELAGHRA